MGPISSGAWKSSPNQRDTGYPKTRPRGARRVGATNTSSVGVSGATALSVNPASQLEIDSVVSGSRMSSFTKFTGAATVCLIMESRRRSNSTDKSFAASPNSLVALPALSAITATVRTISVPRDRTDSESLSISGKKALPCAATFGDALLPILTPRTWAKGPSRKGNPSTRRSRSSGEIGSSLLKYS